MICVLCIVQCAQQPYGSVLCGFYVCEYLRTCSRFSSSWRQLKKAQDWWRMEKVDQDIRQTVADICKFVIESTHEGNTFFNQESELARDPKFDRDQKLEHQVTNLGLHSAEPLFPVKNDMYE